MVCCMMKKFFGGSDPTLSGFRWEKKNTKFFHQRANQRRRKNHTEGLTDKAGVWQTDENKVAEMVEGYYQRLFTTSNPTYMNEVLNSVECVVTDGMQQSLLLLYTEDDVRVAFQVLWTQRNIVVLLPTIMVHC